MIFPLSGGDVRAAPYRDFITCFLSQLAQNPTQWHTYWNFHHGGQHLPCGSLWLAFYLFFHSLLSFHGQVSNYIYVATRGCESFYFSTTSLIKRLTRGNAIAVPFSDEVASATRCDYRHHHVAGRRMRSWSFVTFGRPGRWSDLLGVLLGEFGYGHMMVPWSNSPNRLRFLRFLLLSKAWIKLSCTISLFDIVCQTLQLLSARSKLLSAMSRLLCRVLATIALQVFDALRHGVEYFAFLHEREGIYFSNSSRAFILPSQLRRFSGVVVSSVVFHNFLFFHFTVFILAISASFNDFKINLLVMITAE